MRLRKYFVAFAAVATLAAGVPAATISAAAPASSTVPAAVRSAAPAFTDVTPETTFAKEILWMAEAGVSTGYSDGSYRPLDLVQRDAMAAFLYRYSGKPAVDLSWSPFRDVPTSLTFAEAIKWMRDAGISTGYQDGTYRPMDPVQRDAMAAFLYRMAGSPAYTPPATSPFKDLTPQTTFYKEICWLHAQKISTGWDDKTFRPLEPIKRDAMAAFLYRMKFGVDFPVQVLGFSDFHGHLEDNDPPLPVSIDPDQKLGADGKPISKSGGVEYLATHLANRRAQAKESLTVSAGDSIGGSTFLSGMFQDEPTIEALNAIGVDVSAVGNHELDEGWTEFLRMISGGCHPKLGCFLPQGYAGARFPYVASNIQNAWSKSPMLAPYYIKEFDGTKVGVIGATLSDAATYVDPAGVAGLAFAPEVAAVNAAAAELQAKGVQTIIVSVHQGGDTNGTMNQCVNPTGPAFELAKAFAPSVDLVLTGHTHAAFVCSVPDPAGNPRLVVGPGSWGQVYNETTLMVNSKSKDVVRSTSTSVNRVNSRDVAKDPAQTAIMDKWRAVAGPKRAEVVGTVSADVTGDAGGNRGIETPMADLIADTMLWGTQAPVNGGAQIALMNVGGVRASFLTGTITNGEQPGQITYEEAYKVAPFGNQLVTMDLTGQQLKDVLEQQFMDSRSRKMLALGVSNGFSYTWDPSKSEGQHVVASSMMLSGSPIELTKTYRVATLNFLANGGDGFTAFAQGKNITGGPEDLANLVNYLKTHPGITPPADRVTGL